MATVDAGGAAAAFDVTWDQVIAWCRACDELTDIEIADGVAGLVHLRRIFGENFLSFPPRLFGNLLNQAGWIYRWVAWLSGALRRLEQSSGYEILMRRLVHPDKFEEALSVLETAERLESAGLSVEFDVPLRIGERNKVPDLHIFDAETQASFYCEVSILNGSDDDRKAAERFRRITGVVQRAMTVDLAYAGRLLRVISEARTDELVILVEKAVASVRTSGRLEELCVPDIIEFAVAPITQLATLEAWCHSRDLAPGHFSAPMPETNHLRRLEMKIEREEQQVRYGEANLLVIPSADLFLGMDDPMWRLHDIEEIVLDHPKVGMLVVCFETMGYVPPKVTMDRDNLYVTTNRGDIARQLLIVQNRRCAGVLPPTVAQKLRSAFSL